MMCKVLGHQVNRNRVRRDGESYVSRCRTCGGRMQKTDDGWKLRTEFS